MGFVLVPGMFVSIWKGREGRGGMRFILDVGWMWNVD